MITGARMSEILLHCRIGSLEMNNGQSAKASRLHYRIGSLEKHTHEVHKQVGLHCRIGSLEIGAND